MPSGSEPAWRVLVALLVYNGEDFAGLCLSALTRLKPGNHSVDILVLDDASTAPGWSDRCRDMSTGLGFGYYRTPRNLGTPRNMNLAMQRAKDDRYDAVILLSADTIVPSNLIPALISPLIDDSSVSSTSAWSDDSGVFSIPTADPDHLTGHPDIVDWISEQLSEEFEGLSVALPSGAGHCMALPTAKIDRVGLMDPVFAKGRWTEIDWSLRSHTMGYRSVLVPSCFAHRASWEIHAATGVGRNEDRMDRTRRAVIEERYPSHASQLAAFSASSVLADLRQRGLHRIVVSAARQYGYQLEASRLHNRSDDRGTVRFRIDPDGVAPMIMASYQGFETSFTVGGGRILPTLETMVGQPPRAIRIFDRGPVSRTLEEEAGVSGAIPLSHSPYREGVL